MNWEKEKDKEDEREDEVNRLRPRWPSDRVSAWDRRAFKFGGIGIPPKIRRVRGLPHAKPYVVAKCPPAGVAWKFGEGVPDQVASSSSDHGSKLGSPSQNSPSVAPKRKVNITKLIGVSF
ncbi:hypothetical protein AVEN_270461-1 [Araneus ventricosus]|uniref:Uncharacterized protein n=1 Tax=Araneus ventricosus TaxID=182803 RepID=A0A4Y2B584_ARAVE|nr:hypothetical protein AVEN_270461-1 [Araneus ventricosus]